MCATNLANTRGDHGSAQRDWHQVMPLTKVARLIVCFAPSRAAIPARDFLDRVNAKGVRASNPDCVISTALRRGVEPYVWVEFQDKTTKSFSLKETSGAGLIEKLRVVSRAGDTEALMQKAGLTNVKLGSSGLSDRSDFGNVQKTQIR